MNDRRAELLDEFVACVDVAPLARAEAQMVQADTLLNEALAALLRVRGGDADGRPAADAV